MSDFTSQFTSLLSEGFLLATTFSLVIDSLSMLGIVVLHNTGGVRDIFYNSFSIEGI